MRAKRYLVGFLAVLLGTAAVLFCSDMKPWLELKIFERQVKKSVNPLDLQAWATNLIARHSGEIEHWDQYFGKTFGDDTNLPFGLTKVDCLSGNIRIFTSQRQPSIAIFGDKKGGPFLIVGSSSLAVPTNRTFIMWKPGVYFMGGL